MADYIDRIPEVIERITRVRHCTICYDRMQRWEKFDVCDDCWPKEVERG